jgi:hypothetical protein
MSPSSLDLLRSSLHALRELEAGARERGNHDRADNYGEIADRYEAEISRLEAAEVPQEPDS